MSKYVKSKSIYGTFGSSSTYSKKLPCSRCFSSHYNTPKSLFRSESTRNCQSSVSCGMMGRTEPTGAAPAAALADPPLANVSVDKMPELLMDFTESLCDIRNYEDLSSHLKIQTSLFHSESTRNCGGTVVVLCRGCGGGLSPLVPLLQPASPTHHWRMSS